MKRCKCWAETTSDSFKIGLNGKWSIIFEKGGIIKNLAIGDSVTARRPSIPVGSKSKVGTSFKVGPCQTV